MFGPVVDVLRCFVFVTLCLPVSVCACVCVCACICVVCVRVRAPVVCAVVACRLQICCVSVARSCSPGMCFHLQQRGVFEQVVGNVKNKCYYVLLLGTRRCATIPKGSYSTLVSKPGQLRTTPRIGVRFGIPTGKQARTQPSWLTAAVWSWAPRWPQ